jgi:ADP-ribose pyrophosphatase
MSIRTVGSRVVYSNRWMTVREDQIVRADGSSGIYGIVEKPDFVLIVPIEKSNLYLVEQYRVPVAARFLEFPQGSWEQNQTADPMEIARGELEEETGLRAGRMDYIGHLFVAYGMSCQGFHIFRATQLSQGRSSPEQEEQDLIVKRVAVSDFEQMIGAGQIKDAASISAWALLGIKGERREDQGVRRT